MAKSVIRLASRSGSLLLWLSGARRDILELAPTERTRFYAIGSSVLTSSVAAIVVMIFAFRIILLGALATAVTAGLLWGAVVLSLNLMLMTSLDSVRGLRPALLIAAPRLVL
jgi:hypothetical protein